MQINYTTRQAYKGGNAATLEETQREAGYKVNEWMTFVQARTVNRKVKKGAHGVHLFTMVEVTTGNGQVKQREKKPRTFTVFNLEQTEEVKH